MDKTAILKNSVFGSVSITGAIRKKELRLELLTRSAVSDTHIVRLLSRWRKKHEVWFPAQFPVSEKRTKMWLEKKVIDEPHRLLFMVAVSGTYRGHVGLYRFDLKNKSCEIDNIVRGRIGLPGMMETSIRLMMQWAKKDLGILRFTLQTTSENTRAIALYTRIGFVETKRIPLVYRKTIDGGQWDVAPVGFNKKIKRYEVLMNLAI